jgi:hypothetical protein
MRVARLVPGNRRLIPSGVTGVACFGAQGRPLVDKADIAAQPAYVR